MEDKTGKVLRGVSTQTIVTFSYGALEVLVFSIMSRLLTKSDFGYYACITALVNVFKCFSDAGLGAAVIQKKDFSDNYLSTAFSLSLIMGISLTIILFVSAPFLANLVADSTITIPLRIMSIILLLNSFISIGNAVLTKRLDFKRIGIIKLASYSLASAVAIIMAIKGMGLYSIVSQHIITSFLCAVLLFTTSIKLPKLKIIKEEVQGIVSFGGWFTGSVVMNSISQEVDKFLLPKLLSVQALGSYSRPAGFVTNITSQVNSIFDTVLFPVLSEIQDDINVIKNVFLRSVSLLNVFSFFLAGVFCFNADLIVRIFFGEQWMDLVPILQIISASVIFNIDGRLVDCFFRSMGLVKLGFEIRVGAFLITLFATIVGTRFGIFGVACSLVCSNILVICLKVYILSKKISMPILSVLANFTRSFIPSIPVVILGFLFLFLCPSSIFSDICFALAFSVIILSEMLFFPKILGEEYYNSIYSKYLCGIIKRIRHEK